MSNVIHLPDRRPCPPVVQTARVRCFKVIEELDILAQTLDDLGQNFVEGEAEKRHRQHCEILAQMLREVRARAERI